jgi:5-methylcytosine-specific restriction endonuclease McrA
MTPRQQAIAAGKRRYFTGVPCPKGHISERTVDNSGCVACQDATRAKNRERQRAYTREHYAKNKATYIEKAAEWQHNNPEKRRDIRKRWIAENPEWASENGGRWARENSDRAKENAYRWRRENPDQFKAIAINRRARVAANGGRISGAEIKAIITRQKGKCACCGERAKLEMDHIIPVALGGGSEASNFQGLCRSCNARKNAKHPIDFNRSRGLLL